MNRRTTQPTHRSKRLGAAERTRRRRTTPAPAETAEDAPRTPRSPRTGNPPATTPAAQTGRNPA